MIANGQSTIINSYSIQKNGLNNDYVYGVSIGNESHANFNSEKITSISAAQYSSAEASGKTHTAFGLLIQNPTSATNPSSTSFNSDIVEISAKSDARSQAVTVYNKSTLSFERGNVMISALTEGNDQQRYAIGLELDGTGSETYVRENVENFSVDVSSGGTGSTNATEHQKSGIGITVRHDAIFESAAKAFSILVNDSSPSGSTGGTGVEVNSNGSFILNSAVSNIAVSTKENTVNAFNIGEYGKAKVGGLVQVTATKELDSATANGLDMETNSQFTVSGQMNISASDAAILTESNSLLELSGSNDSFACLNAYGLVDAKGETKIENGIFFIDGDGSKLNDVSIKNGTISLGKGEYLLQNLAGEGKTLEIQDIADTTVSIQEKTGDLILSTTASENDRYASASLTAQALTTAVKINNDHSKQLNLISIPEGTINDSLFGELSEDGSIYNLIVQKNSKVQTLGKLSVISVQNWTQEISTLTDRLGDVRDVPQGIGSWARIYGSEKEFGNPGIVSKSTSIQLGSDLKVDSWTIGTAFSYTDGSSNFDVGEADSSTYGIAFYGTWMTDKGQFIDLMAKYSRLNQDFSISNLKGSYGNNAYALSAEFGWRVDMGKLSFIEPQAQLVYGHISGASFSANNEVSVSQSAYDSIIGRIGIRGGFTFPNEKGVIYAKASMLHELNGDIDGTIYSRRSTATNQIEEDLGGTWFEYGLGAKFNWAENTYTFLDLGRSTGGEVNEKWRWNIGIRHIF